MVMQQENRRPYAAPANVLAVLDRVRTRNLPDLIDGRFLGLAGVPETVYGRVVQALQFIDAIHEDGRPTDKLRAMAGAPDSQFRELLAETIRAAYRDDFARVDPGKDTQGQITDAFRLYEPRSQTDRMVMLFLGLCRAAGIPVLDAPRERKMQAAGTRSNGSRTKAAPKARAPKDDQRNGAGRQVGDDGHRDNPPSAPSLLFGVSVDDVGLLGDEEFTEVWSALGKIARARAKQQLRVAESAATATATVLDDADEQDEEGI